MKINGFTDDRAYIAFFPALIMRPFAMNVCQFQLREKWGFIRTYTPDVSNNTGIVRNHFYICTQMNLECPGYDVI